ncbi:MAG: hypothetical protein ACMXYA_00290 [Candidatus Woesearchaeota archaeon]
MYNMKKFGGTFKGLIGECLFKFVQKKVYLSSFHNIKHVLRKIEEEYSFSTEQKTFISRNYSSIDAIELSKKPIIYEIKTRNAQHSNQFKINITNNSIKILQDAKKLGFEVRLVEILLHSNWNFDCKISDFTYPNHKLRVQFKNRYDKLDKKYITKTNFIKT